MTTPQRWRIAVKDPEWRWWGTHGTEPIEFSARWAADQAVSILEGIFRVIPGPLFVLPGTEPQAVQEVFCCHVCKRAEGEQHESICSVSPGAVIAPRPSPQPVDLNALQKLYDASTPGEWTNSPSGPANDGSDQVRADQSTIPSGCIIPFFICHKTDAAFIAASHNAMPQLLAEVREMREEVLWWANAPAGAAMNEKNSQLAASQEREKRLREAMGIGTAYPVTEVLKHLCKSHRILCDRYSYDGHGWEVLASAYDAAKIIISQLDAALAKE